MTDKNLGITEVVLRDGHQSLLATRFRYEDMEEILSSMDEVGYWSVESWGGAIFDSCIRYLGEDPWERIRKIKSMMPKTQQQMLLRSQNLLGYKHYSDDVVNKFVERSKTNGVDVFRIFDAMNDVRNMQQAIKAVNDFEGHAQGTISYTTSPVHDIKGWVDLSLKLQDLGAQSLAIKDMAGLLKPYVGFELVSSLKEALEIPIHMQCHATTGMSTATGIKAIEAGLDNIDVSISSMSMTYGHSPTESMVAILEGTTRPTNLDLSKLEPVAQHFKEVRKRYHKFEGSLRGVDSRILISQVPGGMLTNLENQLKEQNASEKFDEVLSEIPKVREDLGYIPLVTPTSQIVGTQSVINVLNGERYKSITKETKGVLAGEYGATPAPVNKELQEKALEGAAAITCRPADLINDSFDDLVEEFKKVIKDNSLDIEANEDNTLIYALFPEIGLNYFKHLDDPEFFEQRPLDIHQQSSSSYLVTIDEKEFSVTIDENNNFDIASGNASNTSPNQPQQVKPQASSVSSQLNAPLGGNIFKILIAEGQTVSKDQTLIILEAMKMETEIKSPADGVISNIHIQVGDAVAPGDLLIDIA